MRQTDPWITCKECGRKGRLSTFNNICDNGNCKIIMARRKNNPPAIVVPLRRGGHRHPENCVCARCLDDDADKVEAALLKATPAAKAENAPRQVPVRVRQTESKVVSEYDKDEEALYIEVAPAICINIYPKGKK